MREKVARQTTNEKERQEEGKRNKSDEARGRRNHLKSLMKTMEILDDSVTGHRSRWSCGHGACR